MRAKGLNYIIPQMKTTLNLSPPLAAAQREAETMGVSFPALLTADVVRYRALAAAARPPLDAWQWGLLSHVLDGVEAHHILCGDDTLPSGRRIVAEIDSWADNASDEDVLRAGELCRQVSAWPPPTIAGVLFRLRSGAGR
ncbi:hypothetical protein [Hyphomicrobium sp.]|uniref:hypothetical protein n=1 Tax=Hyphomicrobium sp. TaxID=82 RepID=UPI0025BB09BC|nr:hypothetical protein [Hyphomicrobium sp.]MCC7253826.1 hypothetical protein [Hyphomicrobium sp.]